MNRDLLIEALALPESERAELAGLLLQSLDPTQDLDVEEAWREEIRKRIASIDDGEAEMIPWTEVRDCLFAKLNARQES